MPAKIPNVVKHKTGRPSERDDFFAHACKGTVIGECDGKPVYSKPNAQQVHAHIDWKSPDILLNIYAADSCGYCGGHIEDPSIGWRPITKEEWLIIDEANPDPVA